MKHLSTPPLTHTQGSSRSQLNAPPLMTRRESLSQMLPLFETMQKYM